MKEEEIELERWSGRKSEFVREIYLREKELYTILVKLFFIGITSFTYIFVI